MTLGTNAKLGCNTLSTYHSWIIALSLPDICWKTDETIIAETKITNIDHGKHFGDLYFGNLYIKGLYFDNVRFGANFRDLIFRQCHFRRSALQSHWSSTNKNHQSLHRQPFENYNYRNAFVTNDKYYHLQEKSISTPKRICEQLNRSNEQSKRARREDFNQQQQANRYSPNVNTTSQSRNLKIMSPNHGTALKTERRYQQILFYRNESIEKSSRMQSSLFY